jgi:hypothetical protein
MIRNPKQNTHYLHFEKEIAKLLKICPKTKSLLCIQVASARKWVAYIWGVRP